MLSTQQPSRNDRTVRIAPSTHPTTSIFYNNNCFTEAAVCNDTTSDSFRMYEFKVGKCASGNCPDWTDCPYVHPGEKAHRRDPRKFNYSGACCPDFRKGNCKKGVKCEYAHGVFECWLHPSRYRTQSCKDGVNCRRKVCFFAHTSEQLRVPRHTESTLINPVTEPFVSPRIPVRWGYRAESSPTSFVRNSTSELACSLRQLQLLSKLNSFPPYSGTGSMTRAGSCSVPPTPRSIQTTPVRIGFVEEEPAMERVESGKSLREHMLQKLRYENSLI